MNNENNKRIIVFLSKILYGLICILSLSLAPVCHTLYSKDNFERTIKNSTDNDNKECIIEKFYEL